jgi:hypothetical protein
MVVVVWLLCAVLVLALMALVAMVTAVVLALKR